MADMYELMVEESFDAAHALRGYKGPCENLHGHTWKVQVFLKGDKLNKIGILADFKDLKKALKDGLSNFDHANLNDLPEFKEINPSSENIAKIIFDNLSKSIAGLIQVKVWESPTSCASYFK
ncbi:MAG: 6-carboxytetrahydropterin synthase QueD [bacterium]